MGAGRHGVSSVLSLIALALGVDLLPWHVVAGLLAVNLSTMLSITPANLGVYEASLFLVVRAAGIDPDLSPEEGFDINAAAYVGLARQLLG
ncbi:MAG: flippase-like domain-containing protein [Chloroflexi bacterium]|nr:flippase-like domain-containing protein [Chloroflexota bacterium]